MAEISINEYIRTKNGFILKLNENNIVNIFNFDDEDVYIDLEKEGLYFEEDKIVKHSKNIIDLIEEHDLLKIEYVISNNKKQMEVVEVIKNYQGLLYVNTFVGKFFVVDLEHYDRKMLSIVTKEQFANMEYRLED